MNSGPNHASPGAGDYELGRRIATLIAEQAASKLPATAVFGQVQDLLGADTALLGPLRDLLVRPAFRQLFAGDQRSVQVGGRDALLQELAQTYHPAVVQRLAIVIDGSLGLPPTPPPAGGVPGGGSAWGTSPSPSGQASAWNGGASVPPQGQPAYSQPAYSQPAYPQPPAGQPAYSQPQVPPPAPNPSGPSAVTALLIALVSVLSGAVLLGLGWLLLSSRPQPVAGSAPAASASPPQSPAATPQAPAAPPASPKGATTITPASPSEAWGGPSDYKFGQVPGGAYPNSCAFSVTDTNGRTTTDKSQIEYWACRDVGGNPESGYRVVWADGKETTYTFASGGDGQVVGTNGSTYPMSWRNDTHRGQPIIVISHQDGATSWIPGNVD